MCVIAAATRTAATVPGGRLEGQLAGVGARGRRGDQLADGAVADLLVEGLVVEQVPGPRPRLVGGRLDEVELRPADLVVVEELLPALVEDPRVAPVDLRERDEAGLVEVDVGHVAAVELVQAGAQRGFVVEADPQAVAGAPGVGPQPKRRRRPNVPLDQLGDRPENRRSPARADPQ